jgi:subtilase family serine protease
VEQLAMPSNVVMSPTYLISDTHQTHNSRPLNPQAGPALTALSPTQIRAAYGINNITFTNNGSTTTGDGTGQTIAIVDAYDDPSISADLTAFDTYYNLPAPPSFTKVGISAGGAASTSSFPMPNSGWAPAPMSPTTHTRTQA